ncbi:TetR/AcrR family transcriptional regulator [Paenarthrobacter nitroguajacolicus]|uniref:TetR/AcrR family transcriptional regulator n=1 Tax=Paenarthrobacter nitroguajacolicus TaxID=211146 RepID=UPI0015C01D65|nr:TetR/AcrR family transcriptional regulator [Paenarthrobacter nitroguajacolicus]NWL31733.1 TetR family transcriptional regulator [Paenarthrobacter nitroguajacolicus]
MNKSSTAPERGTRPRNRRALILAAAGDLFAQKGYPQVSMTDVAKAMAVQPSALYRHFPGKGELLREAVVASLQPFLDSITQAPDGDLEQLVTALGRAMLVHRENGVLWERESRHLPPAIRFDIASGIKFAISSKLQSGSSALPAPEADLRAWAMFAAMISVSLDPNRLSRADEESQLTTLARTVLVMPMPPIEAVANHRSASIDLPRTRREALLAASIRQFAANGFDAVSLDDIGAEVGVAGPSIYRHFDSKAEMLAAALHRAKEVRWMDMSRALAEAADAAEALERILSSYIAFSLGSPEFLQLAVSERPHLPERELRNLMEAQSDYITDVASLVQDVYPGADQEVVRTRVKAALHVVGSVVRTPFLRDIRGIQEILEQIAGGLIAPTTQ